MKVSNWSRSAILGAAVTFAPLGALLLPNSVAFAGEGGVGHSHSSTPATKDQVLETAKKVKAKLIGDGKVGAAFKDIVPDTAEQKEFKGKKEWVVTFKDPNAADKSKETLFLFFSLTGNYLASNFTGK
jgi:hypothetical protein